MTTPLRVPDVLLKAVEAAVNRTLALDPDMAARLAQINGKVIAVDLRGPDVVIYLAPHADGIRFLGRCEGEPDTVLSGAPSAFLRLGTSAHPARVLFSGDVHIRGDVELGRRFKAAIDGMEIDCEEQLARLVGDVAAHQLGNMVRDGRRWMREAVDTLSRDVAEYLHEEARLVPEPGELEAFLTDVDTLRSDAERLEQRIARLRGGAEEGRA